jgi:hypothetical protein
MMPASERRCVIPENQIDYLMAYGSQWGAANITEVISRVIADHRIAGLQMVATHSSPMTPPPIAPTSIPVETMSTSSPDDIALANLLGD